MPDAFTSELIAITEAPLDAITVTQASSIPAIALCGKCSPEWLGRKLLGKRVFIALDDDDPGNEAARGLTATLEKFGARCVRLTFDGAKDANQSGLASVRDGMMAVCAAL